ncbi:MAG: hypothetical protein FVQ77_07645 [Cytophagales bacterium]|nr:hypothetical protein [Cytophagales bacterium]
MRYPIYLLISILAVSRFSFSQESIYHKDEYVIKNIQLLEIHPFWIVYEKKCRSYELEIDKIDKIETENYEIIDFDDHYKPVFQNSDIRSRYLIYENPADEAYLGGKVIFVSEAVGATIDLSEKMEYYLFPFWDNGKFLSAQFIKLPDGSIILRGIMVDSLTDIVDYSKEDFWLTKNLIEGQTIANARIIITSKSGYKYKGTLLHAADSVLILWNTKQPYSINAIDKYAKSLYYSDMKRITIDRKSKIIRGMSIGSLIGASIGLGTGIALPLAGIPIIVLGAVVSGPLEGLVFVGITATGIGFGIGALHRYNINENISAYKALLPHLKKRAIFQSILPAELKNLEI